MAVNTQSVMPRTWHEHATLHADRTPLTYWQLRPSAASDKALVVLDGALDEQTRVALESLGLNDFTIFVRGAPQGPITTTVPGDRLSLDRMVNDIDAWIHHLADHHHLRAADFVVIASEMNATLAMAWAHDYAPRIRAMVLLAPRFRIPSAAESKRESGVSLVSSWEQRKMFRYTIGRLVADAAAIRIPTLLLEDGKSRAFSRRPLLNQFFARLNTTCKRRQSFAASPRGLLLGPDAISVANEVRQFVAEAFRQSDQRPSLLRADRSGYTYEEFQYLKRPLPWFSPRGLRYRLARMGLHCLALISPGIRLAVRNGFDSGQMLDYAYENRARGWPPLRWIDRIFLDNIGWKACRRRKELTERMLREAIGRVAATGRPVQILDIAAGPGRYILDILRSMPDADLAAVLCDNMAANLEDGRRLADSLGLTNVVYQLGDAFDEDGLACIAPVPNLAVACGIYQLFDDNDLLLRSLRGLYRALRGGGYLVYTSLPWDPGLELGARALVNRLGQLAVRRRRTQEELDELVATAGFEKKAMQIDEFGMSTVSLAMKPWATL